MLKKDKATNEVIIVEEGPPENTPAKEKNDHISKDELPSDQRFKEYIYTVNEAVGYIQEGLYEQAVEKLKNAIMLDSSLPYAYDNLANAYYHQHKYQEAMAMSIKAIEIDPNYANAYGNLGNACYALRRYNEAKENYQKAKKLFLEKGDLEGVARTDESLAQSFSP